jgi:hypothetical protein
VEEEFCLEQVAVEDQVEVEVEAEDPVEVVVVQVSDRFNVQVVQEELELQQVEAEVHLEDFLMMLLLQGVVVVGELVEVVLLLPGAMSQVVLEAKLLHSMVILTLGQATTHLEYMEQYHDNSILTNISDRHKHRKRIFRDTTNVMGRHYY